jgi:hypothetical protein
MREFAVTDQNGNRIRIGAQHPVPPPRNRSLDWTAISGCNPTATRMAANDGECRSLTVGHPLQSWLVTAAKGQWRSRVDKPVVALITRRSQVQILPPPLKKPWSATMAGQGFVVQRADF